MSCNFNKYRNALGVYRVVTDSVLTNAITNGKNFEASVDLPSLLDYFKDFQYQAEDVEEYVKLALHSVVDSYNEVLKTLNEQGIINVDSLTDNEIKLLRNNFSNQLEKLYDLPSSIIKNKPQTGEVEVKHGQTAESQFPNTITIDGVQPKQDLSLMRDTWSNGSLKTPQNLDIDASVINTEEDVKSNYYSSAGTAATAMFRDLTKKVFNMRILQPLKAIGKTGNESINNEIRNYKNELFKKLIEPLNLNLEESQKVLYDNVGNLIQPNYKVILNTVKEQFKKMNGGLGVRAEDILSWNAPNNNNYSLRDQYNAFVILSNFDTLLTTRSGKSIIPKENYFNQEVSADKYILTSTNKMRTGYSDDTIVHSDDETTKLYQMFVETIPVIKLNGRISSNSFLNTAVVNHTIGVLKNEIDNTDPITSLENLLIDVLSNLDSRGGRNLNNTQLSTLLSLYGRVFRTAENDSKIMSNNSNFSNILNSMNKSTDFTLNNSITGLFSNVHSNGQDINFLDLIGANVAKVDMLAYNEVVYDYSTNAYVSRSLTSQLNNRQRGSLRSGIGGSILFKTKDNINEFLSTYHLKVGENHVDLFLNGKTIRYNVISGSFSNIDPTGKSYNINSIQDVVDIPNHNLDSADIFQIEGDTPQYNDYKQIVNTFEKIFNQPLSSDNYKLLDIFRTELDSYDDATQGKHVEAMLTLIGNYAYLADLNSKMPNISGIDNAQRMNMINSRIGSNFPANKVWDTNQKRYKIDFNKSGIGALNDLADVINNYYGSGITNVIKNTEGNLMPTSSLMSPINRYNDIVQDFYTKNDFTSPLASNLFIRANDQANPLILGTVIRSGVRSKNGDVISPSRLNTKELLQSSIMYEFLQGRLSDDGNFSVQPSNYADKSKQNLLRINSQTPITLKNGSSKPYGELTIDELSDLYFNTIYDQYSAIADKQISGYDILFNKENNESDSVLQGFISKDSVFLSQIPNLDLESTYEQIPDEYKGTDFNNEWKKFDKLRTLLNEYKTTKNKLDVANEIFSNLSGGAIKSIYNKAGLEYVANLTFEVNPVTGKMGVNSSLISELKKYNTSNISKEVAKIEKQFLESLENERFTLDYYNEDMSVNKLMEKAVEHYNLKDAFSKDIAKTGRLTLKDSKGNLNPILKDYLWNNLLISRNFQFLTVGSPLGHPAKVSPKFDKNGKKIPPTSDEIMAARLVAQNKRMVIHPATMHPYTMNLINGIGFKSKKLFVSDPAAPVFNLTGLEDEIDAPDGSSLANPLQVNLYNASLLDQKVGRTHKSIAGIMDVSNGAAGLTKHALFSITNENLRNSPTMNTINMQMLNQNFNKLGDFDLGVIDITRDYNNKHINLSEIVGEVSFTANEFVQTLSTLVPNASFMYEGDLNQFNESKLLTFKDLSFNNGNFEASYIVNKNEEDVLTWTGNINNYNTLWHLLGGRFSVEYSNNNLGNAPSSILDGYTNSNTSWDAMTEYVNRVGFWYNGSESNGDFLTIRDMINVSSPSTLRSIKQTYNNFLHNPNPVSEDKSPVESRPSQKNIIQPLKLNFLGEFTFNSGQKVGAKNVISVEDVLAGNLNFSYESNIHNGIQLNADHEADQSEVTEQTQVIGTLSFTGNTPEYARKVFNSINRYITENLGDIMSSINANDYGTNPEVQDKVLNLLKRIIVKTFDDKDVDSLANSLVQVIKKEISDKVANNMALPLSSPDLYGAVNTALANYFTKEGIRRKMPGMAAVAKPYATLTKFKKLPDGTTVSHSQFEKWRLLNSEVSQYTPLQPNHLKVGDTIVNPNGDRIYISSPRVYLNVKRDLQQNSEGWTIDNFADRELESTHHTFIIPDVGEFNFFDIDVIAMPNLLGDVKNVYNNIVKLEKAIANKHILSPLQISQNGTLEERLENAKVELNTLIGMYNSTIDSGNVNVNIIPKLNESNIYTDYSPVQQNYIRNIVNQELKRLHDTRKIRTPLFSNLPVNQEFNVDIKTNLGEIAMSFPHASTFGIPKGVDINDISENFFYNKLNAKSLPSNELHDLYIKNSDGDHLYVLIEGSDNHNQALMMGIEPISIETVQVDNKTYSVDQYGRQKDLLGYDTLYRGIIDGKVTDYVVVSSSEDMQRLKEMTNANGSKYDLIVPNYLSGTSLLPTFLNYINQGYIDASNNAIDTLNRLHVLGKRSNDPEHTIDIYEKVNLEKYNPEYLLDELNKVNDILANRLSNSDRIKLTNKKVLIEEYLEHLQNIEPGSKPTEEMNDLIREIYAVEISNWADKQLQYLNREGIDVSENNSSVLKELQRKELKRIDNFNHKKAKAIYASFLKSLEVTTARIPGQDRQSYAGMKVVQFFNDEENVIYVPPRFQWTTGGDFDIDKVFTMYYTIGKDNLISGWSTLFDKRDVDFLNTSLELPVPNNIEITNGDVDYGVNGASLGQLTSIMNYVDNNRGDRDQQLAIFKDVVNVLRNVDENNKLIINSPDILHEVDINKIIKFINKFNLESGDVYDTKGATLNSIFSGIKDSIVDIRNIAESYLPVTFGEYSKKASKSKKGAEMARMSYENPVDIFRAQVANMVGKEVIGIAASSGLKAFSALSYVMMDVLKGNEGVIVNPNLTIPQLVNGNEIRMIKTSGVKGINFLNNPTAYRTYLQTMFNLPTEEIDYIMEKQWEQGSVSLDLSALLSAATDNAKELILGRINAGPDTATFYLAASILGVDVDTISTLMTSDTTEAIIKLASRDVYKDRAITFDSALQQVSKKILESKNYFDFSIVGNIVLNVQDLQLSNGKTARQLVEDAIYNDSKKGKKVSKEEYFSNYNVTKNPWFFINKLTTLLTDKDVEIIQNSLKKHKIRNIKTSDFNLRSIRNKQVSSDVDLNAMDGDYDFNSMTDSDMDLNSLGDDSFTDLNGMGQDMDFNSLTEESVFGSTGTKEVIKPLHLIFGRYVNDYNELIKTANVNSEILKALNSLNIVAKDLTKLARITSINQKVKNTFLDLKKYNDLINEVRSTPFDVNQEMAFNLDDLINKSPHLSSMVNAATSAFEGFKKAAIKNRILDNLFTNFSADFKLDQLNFVKLNNFADEFIIGQALFQLSDLDTSFSILNGSVLSSDYTNVANTSIQANIKTAEGRTNFINWIENTVIPDLKRGRIVDIDEQAHLARYAHDPTIETNEFVKRLTTDLKNDPNTNDSFIYYRIPVDMLATRSESDIELLETLKINFSKIANKQYAGRKLSDLFYLYDLIVNKGKVTSTSLKPLLNGVTDYTDDSLMTKVVRTIGEFDKRGENLLNTINPNILKEYLSAKGLGKDMAGIPSLGTDTSNNETFIKVRRYDADEKKLVYDTYFLNDGKYVQTKPNVISKYLNIPTPNSRSEVNYNNNVLDSIMRDRLNNLIAKAKKTIINC